MPQYQQQHENDTAVIKIIDCGASDIAFAYRLVPFADCPAIRHGASDQARWLEPVRRGAAHRSKSLWLDENSDKVRQYKGKWIAVSGNEVVADADEFAEVRAFLDQHSIANALITHVDASMDERRIFID